MLVLSRKQNERIRIGDDITVTVVEIQGDKVKIGIEADRAVPVHREEIYRLNLRKERDRPTDGLMKQGGGA